ncbi:MAG TPA: HAD family hydrolase [Chthoniobacterales bacterium]
MKLLLFDVDGTLLKTQGVGRVAVCQAAKDVFEIEEDLIGITVAGNTDDRILSDILSKHGLTPTQENIDRFKEGYLERLSENLRTRPGYVLPGIVELLDAIDAIPWAKGLLTGNMERGARIKLGAYGLSSRFEFGAFADDSTDRNELGPFAKKRAEARYGRTFDLKDIFVIGDTPRDIACGRAFGAQTVAVATGQYRSEELMMHEPDFLFEDFASTAETLTALGYRTVQWVLQVKESEVAE